MSEGVETGMEAVITSLTSTISADALWGVFAQVVPLIGITVLVALGFFLVKKAIKKASKAKAGV